MANQPPLANIRPFSPNFDVSNIPIPDSHNPKIHRPTITPELTVLA